MKKVSSLFTAAFVFVLGFITSAFSASQTTTYVSTGDNPTLPVNATKQEKIKIDNLKYENLTNSTKNKLNFKFDNLKVNNLTVESNKFENLQNKTTTGSGINWDNHKENDLNTR